MKDNIPVYDICTLSEHVSHWHDEIIAEPFEIYLSKHPNLVTPHRHNFFHAVLFNSGNGYHTVDFKQYKLSPGQMYFMSPGQVHSWHFNDVPTGYIFNFSESILQHLIPQLQLENKYDFFRGVAQDCVVQLNATTHAIAQSISRQIITEVKGKEFAGQDVVAALFIQLFGLASRFSLKNSSSTQVSPGLQIVNNYRMLVDKEYSYQRLTKHYANLLHVSPNYLNLLCQQYIGMQAGTVIRNRILLECKRLLVNANLNISEIANALNFTDASHFSRFFKQHTGMTPDQFRKNATIAPYLDTE